jgi:leader peptidase (prepilin peptidase)/N-methyltransferase
MFEWLLVLLVGLCVGSFLNVAILRIPEDKSILFPASHCPSCQHPLSWYHNIPLLSWIFLRGKCAFCHTSISYQYPLIELVTALVYLSVFLHVNHLLYAFVLGTLFALLLALSVIDLRYKAVPDALSIPALLLSFCTATPLDALHNGILFMGGFAFLRIVLSSLLKKEVMGEADIIIAGIIGAVVGIKLGLFAIYLSAVIALIAFVVVRKRGYELPYIPFLSGALFITWLFKTPILLFLEALYE